jgi:hypothetical protein
MSNAERADSLTYAKITIRYVRGQLATMDGSFKRGLRRIGVQQYKAMIRELLALRRGRP